MFVDEANITVKGGDGGNGIISFRKEYGQRKGGPDGGNGGSGGDVYLKSVRSMGTLLTFNKQQVFKAENGASGGSQTKRGKSGSDVYIDVPIGTIVRDRETGEKLADLTEEGEIVLIARGGEGGKGNSSFTSSTRKAPRIREWGEPGEKKNLTLELRLLADVGIIGFPNVGKSTLISTISAQKPKIANYHFTTLDPHPGVVKINDWKDFVAVDIPGLIKGAHKGKGLGNKFLRHLGRTRLLLHVVDISGTEGRDPYEDWKALRRELNNYGKAVANKPEIVAGNKADLIDESEISSQISRFQEKGITLHPISALTDRGVNDLIDTVYQKLQSLQDQQKSQSGDEKPQKKVYQFVNEQGFKVIRTQDKFIIRGRKIEKLATHLDLSTEDALRYFYNQLERKGVVRELEKKGASNGSVIEIGGKEFEFVS